MTVADIPAAPPGMLATAGGRAYALGIARAAAIVRKPWFWTGLGVRCAFIVLLLPDAVSAWYLPFLTSTGLTADPWGDFLATGGTIRAFPYGVPMFIALRLGVLAAQVLGVPAHLGYGATLVAADAAVMWSLGALRADADTRLPALYWLSPISIFALYWLGFNDVLPILFVVLCLVALRQRHPRAGAVLAALGVAAKLSMVITLPFILIFLIRNNKHRAWVVPFLTTLLAAFVVLQLPYAYSAGARAMLFQNPELWKLLAFQISWASGLQIYVFPLLYLFALFGAWQLRRMSFDLLLSMLGLSFFLVLTLTPAPPGWFVWVLPFLVLHQWENGQRALLLVLGYSALYVGFQLVHAPIPRFIALPNAVAGQRLCDLLGITGTATSLWQTTLVGVGLVITLRMLRVSVYRNEYFRLSRKTFVLGIGGDSGSGKDTLAGALSGLFGAHSVAHLSGDDYHLWDRQKPIWQVMTHLDPRGNDLDQLSQDIRALTDGRVIRVPRYDHDSGHKSRPTHVPSNDFVIATGLHVLYTPELRELFELAVFLDMDEGLRRHFKVARDTAARGYSREQVVASLEQRRSDSDRYIAPQADNADLVLSLRPAHPSVLDRPVRDAHLKLVARSRHGIHHRALVRVLMGLCGLQVDLVYRDPAGPPDISIEGSVDADAIAASARELIPHIDDLLDLQPRWQGGMTGLMQLLVLVHVVHALRKRLA